jgi:hypothetical protein
MKIRILFLVFALALGACAKKSSSGSSDGSSTDGGGSAPLDPIPAANYFYVHGIPESNIESYTHIKDQAWDSKCKIDLDAATDAERDIMCVVEMKEADIYFTDLTLQYNIPEHPRCRYITVMPYFFFRYEPGEGPGVVNWTEDANGTKTSLTFSGGGTGSTVSFGEDGAVRCGYDYTANEGPNCCVGSYTVNILHSDTSSTSTETRQWGGDLASCLGGPAVDLQPKDSKQWPIPITYRLVASAASAVESAFAVRDVAPDSAIRFGVTATASPTPAPDPDDGNAYKKDMTIKSPNKWLFGNNVYTANYYEDTTALPKAVKFPAESRFSGNAFYDYKCIDEAAEVYAHIRVMVRDWNTKSEFIKTSNSADANVSGGEPYFDDDYNDRWDWKDFGTLYPGASL